MNFIEAYLTSYHPKLNGTAFPRSRGLALSATFAAMISVLALFSIPIPFSPVPVTLQVLGVYLASTILGPVYGTFACLIYLLLGAAGLPVFAGPSSGPPVLFGPFGGYLFSYPIAALAGGVIARIRSRTKRGDALRLVASCLVSLAVIYAIGVSWLAAYLGLGIYEGIALGAVPFVPFDAVKAVVAAIIALRVRWASIPLPSTSRPIPGGTIAASVELKLLLTSDH